METENIVQKDEEYYRYPSDLYSYWGLVIKPHLIGVLTGIYCLIALPIVIIVMPFALLYKKLVIDKRRRMTP